MGVALRGVLLVTLVASPAFHGGARPDSSLRSFSPHGASETRVGATDRFEFHSDPWINLHHFLYQWSRSDEGLGTGRQHVPVPERDGVGGLSPELLESWMMAVAFYRDSVAARDHFDRGMLLMKRDLRKLDGVADVMIPDHIPGIANALTEAMAVYVQVWWPRHDEANRDWIAGVLPLVDRHEEEFVETTEQIYGSIWPDAAIRIDVSAYANWAAGYTATGHTVIYSTDPGNQGLYALETVLHEVQHTRAVGGPGRESLYATFEEAGVEVPENLWHALIFQTAGQFVQAVAVWEGLPEHTPYWIRENFEGFRGWRSVISLAKAQWSPVVAGSARAEDGFDALVESVGSSTDDP